MPKQPMCAVPDCVRPAAYEVRLYDYYPEDHITFNERDFTCPFLCAEHQAENEQRARGRREPRGYVVYPYTNKNGAYGYTKYRKLKSE